jgi:hypothetical protein
MDQDRKQIRKGEEKRNGRKITRKSELAKNEKGRRGGNEERYGGKKRWSELGISGIKGVQNMKAARMQATFHRSLLFLSE